MKARHVQAEAVNARATLESLRIDPDQDFHALSRDQVAGLEREAKRVRYQAPKDRNGSTARYFHARLVRRAGMKGDK